MSDCPAHEWVFLRTFSEHVPAEYRNGRVWTPAHAVLGRDRFYCRRCLAYTDRPATPTDGDSCA